MPAPGAAGSVWALDTWATNSWALDTWAGAGVAAAPPAGHGGWVDEKELEKFQKAFNLRGRVRAEAGAPVAKLRGRIRAPGSWPEVGDLSDLGQLGIDRELALLEPGESRSGRVRAGAGAARMQATGYVSVGDADFNLAVSVALTTFLD
jgi:hypothetical protein